MPDESRHECDQIIAGDHWRVSVLGPQLMRFEWDPDGGLVDEPTQVVAQRPMEPVSVAVARRGDAVQVITETFQFDWDGKEPSASGLSVRARNSYHSVWRYGMPMENKFDELSGHRTNLGGTTRTLDTIDGSCPVDDGLCSRLGISVLDDSRSFVMGSDGVMHPPSPRRLDVYVFTHGNDHGATIQDFYRLTTPPPLIPRYAFGNWWSRFHKYTQEGYLELVDRFAAEDLPFSVAVIDMDWHITEVDRRFGNGWTGYTWNRTLFPDPEAFLRGLHERGLAVTLNVHPADGIRAFEDSYARVCEIMGRDPELELPVDFDLNDPQFIKAYFEGVHHPLEDQGVDFWWIDWQQGTTSSTGLDPLWLLNHLHVQDMERRGKRPLILSRYCGPGSHRYPVGFSGDTIATWASLDFQPWFTAAAANIGYGIWSHDIGGHAFGERNDELALRWLQFGVLSPINRLHSTDDPFLGKEPWKFSPEVAEIMGRFLRWRHELVPYLYTEWATGLPIVRPMYHTHGENPHSYDIDNEYWLGRGLLVAPVTTPVDADTRMGAVKVWLPEGQWVDLLTGVRYDGDRTLTMHRPLDSVPVLAQEGTIIPHAGAGTRASELPEVVELWVVLGADGEYELLEDDGALEPAVARTRMQWDDAAGRLVVSAAAGEPSVLPERRTWRARFLGGLVESSVGSRDAATGALVVELGTAAVDEELVWTAPEPLRPGSNEVQRRTGEWLERAQTAAAHKSHIQRIVASETDPLRTVTALREQVVRGAVKGERTNLPDSLMSAAAELVIAHPE
ncbi:alpha-xylosidase [Aestuariimicrobium sp. p3-SID1156]|uniref:TIM-barrel domain-containing protein n=1 Tax=Aestuariimicrobium sp. p3-SID1156 TaxID=2916038 RepID=UPI00223A69AB|nr:TIM-barrel domain-containing protein [Aestuariimicrobium sp. p3-SID1156]MCT1458610.1 alpha-xylosidase [Aestuariimicrobium sp. p3-SID1156]